ncbi:PTS sugar transporter subunit IIA [Paenibacillus sp. YN15]|uniref:PTS sugar transporter subunit IIA n=1 Tax=Paenibacillus sp. YN15 TaxID=1742774 RepID=UPI000DCC00A5|nr:fructose PTS transporter subunit IIA [Paenibacillus sp. YN15]RAV01737.1 PTS fructose transporter subunit IIA [Paenibacillus sp. YN15]
MTITELLDSRSVLIPLDAQSKEEAIGLLADGLAESGSLSDKAAYLEAVLQREATGSTGIGFGVAIPHGKSPGVAKAGIAFAKLARPLEWASLDGNPVQAVFMIAVPQEAAGNDHLKVLIAISRKLIDDEFRGKLLAVADYEELAGLLAGI